MKMRYFEQKKARIEIIPMIDVMLFLLVFFIIVTMQMIPDAGVSMQLPVSSQTDPLPHPAFTVNVLPDGSIKLKGTDVTAEQLTKTFASDGAPNKTELTIVTDKTTPFQHFMTVIDAALPAETLAEARHHLVRVDEGGVVVDHIGHEQAHRVRARRPGLGPAARRTRGVTPSWTLKVTR